MTWGTDRLTALKTGAAEPPPVVRTLKLGLIDDWGPGWARKRWTASPELLNVDGSMFGGYLAALADQMLALAALSVIADDCGMRTANLTVQFFKLARGEPLVIESRVLSHSKSIIAVEAEFRRDDGELIAKAGAQQIVTPRRH